MGGISKTLRFVLLGDDKTATKSLKNVGAGFRNAFKDAKGFAGKSKLIGGALLGIGVAAVAAGAAIAVKFGKDSVNTFKRVAGETRSLSRITGMTAEESSRLGFAFKRTGIDAATGSKSMGIFAKNVVAMSQKDAAAKLKAQAHADAIKQQIKALESAGPSSKGYADKMSYLKDKLATATAASHMNASALGALGITYTDAHGKMLPMSTLLPQVADKFAKMPDGAEKSAAAMKLFGKGGLAMLPFLNKGAAGLRELGIESDKTGNTMSGKMLDAAKENALEQKKLDAAMQGAQITLGSMLLPIMTQGAQLMNSVLIPAIQGVTTYIKENQGTFDAMGEVMRQVWNGILLPLVKAGIIGFAMMNKPLASTIRMMGVISGNKDMENLGKGLEKATDDAIGFANGLKGIPKAVKPKIMADTSQAEAKTKAIDSNIQRLNKERITLRSHGDTAGVKKIDDAIRVLQAKKNTIPIPVGAYMLKSADEIKYKVGKSGTMKFSAAATGGWRSGMTRYNEYGPEMGFLSHATYIATAAQSSRMLEGARAGMAMASAGAGSGGGVTLVFAPHIDPLTNTDDLMNKWVAAAHRWRVARNGKGMGLG
ncbi:MAG TPA: phage tail tape measure protein [Propionicimonas sp.]|jgi:TP901 family phage tail tape measure protein